MVFHVIDHKDGGLTLRVTSDVSGERWGIDALDALYDIHQNDPVETARIETERQQELIAMLDLVTAGESVMAGTSPPPGTPTMTPGGARGGSGTSRWVESRQGSSWKSPPLSRRGNVPRCPPRTTNALPIRSVSPNIRVTPVSNSGTPIRSDHHLRRGHSQRAKIHQHSTRPPLTQPGCRTQWTYDLAPGH